MASPAADRTALEGEVEGTSNNGKDNALEKVDKDKDEQDDKRDSNSTVNSDGIVKRDSNSADINSDGIIKTDSNRADANSDGIVKHDSNSADVNSNGIARRDMNSADVNSDGIDKCNSVTGEIIDDNVAYLYRVTDRCGKVTYHVVYDTGEEKKFNTREIFNHVSSQRVRRYESRSYLLEENMETEYDIEENAGFSNRGTNSKLLKHYKREAAKSVKAGGKASRRNPRAMRPTTKTKVKAISGGVRATLATTRVRRKAVPKETKTPNGKVRSAKAGPEVKERYNNLTFEHIGSDNSNDHDDAIDRVGRRMSTSLLEKRSTGPKNVTPKALKGPATVATAKASGQKRRRASTAGKQGAKPPRAKKTKRAKSPSPSAEDEATEYEVEYIERHRYVGKMKQYLIKWVGYDRESSSWEPASIIAVGAAELVVTYEKGVAEAQLDGFEGT